MLLKLMPVKKHILWGGDKLSREYGIGDKGEKVAEAWQLTCRSDGDNVIENGKYAGKTFSEFVRDNPESIGTKNTFDRFPLLIKLIDAGADLSIQVHPNDDYARLHTKELGKTEMWYIVEAEKGARIAYGLKRKYSRKELEKAIEEGKLEEYVNYVNVKAGETYFIPSGTVHAICAGLLIAEIQQDSNITYRVYDYNRRQPDGSLRQLHIEDALNVIETVDPSEIEYKSYDDVIAECRFFKVRVIDNPEDEVIDVNEESFLHIMCVEGSVSVSDEGGSAVVNKGGSLFVPASNGKTTMTGKGKIVVTTL